MPPRSRGPIRAPEPPPPYWAHYAHRPVPAGERIGGAASSSSPSTAAHGRGSGGGGAPAAAATSRRHQAATTTDDSVTSNDRPRAHRGRSTSGDSSSIGATVRREDGREGPRGGGPERAEPAAVLRHRYNVPNQQRQRIKEHLLSQDAFCPDLVRNCKNIATESPERQPSPAPVEYAEIGEVGRALAAVAINDGASTSAVGRRQQQEDVTAASSTNDALPSSSASGTAGIGGAAPAATMGQNLSIRRPKISLTWVLREQSREGTGTAGSGSTNQAHPQQPPVLQSIPGKCSPAGSSPVDKTSQCILAGSGHAMAAGVQSTAGQITTSGTGIGASPLGQTNGPTSNGSTLNGHTHHHHHVIVRKKSRTRSKERLFSEKYVSDNNLSEYHSEKLRSVVHANEYTAAPTATPTGASSNLYRKSNRKNSERLKKKDRLLLYPNGTTVVDGPVHHNNNNQHAINLNKEPAAYGEGLKEKLAVALKNTYSEPSLYTTVSEPSASTKHRHHSRHHHRRRRERYRSQRFGYEIQNVDEFLSKCSLSSPGNIPVVLSSAATLYQTRPGSYQIEIPLPLGMVVNAVFKNQNWLYVQTPHAEEGYVAYDTCLPLGILPSNQRSSSSSKPTPCWESNKDVFPKPCGNLTDSEKEIQQLRGGTRSEGRRTPRLKRSSANSRSAVSITACNSERDLDSLYLRTVASNQPKTADGQAQYAQLKLTTKTLLAITENYCSDAVSVHKGDVVTLLACKEYQEKGLKNYKQWFFVRTRDGHEGYIPAEAAGHGREQIELESKGRREYRKKWGYITQPATTEFYDLKRNNQKLREIQQARNQNVSLREYDGHGESFFVSKQMFKTLLDTCRCGRKRTNTHALKCLQKPKNTYEKTDDEEEDEELEKQRKQQQQQREGRRAKNGSGGSAREGEESVETVSSYIPKVPTLSSGMYGWPQNRFVAMEKTTYYVSPRYTMPGHPIVDSHPYNNIILG
uniref:SH3 domain-containing protein n=1 Tax=Anopheles melas TaxID=34690 RepID=A0A182TZB0_9DIPT